MVAYKEASSTVGDMGREEKVKNKPRISQSSRTSKTFKYLTRAGLLCKVWALIGKT